MYGQQRLQAEFERCASYDVERIVSHVVNDVMHHMVGQADDLTVLACRVGQEPEAARVAAASA
jgi:hypothetical protein